MKFNTSKMRYIRHSRKPYLISIMLLALLVVVNFPLGGILLTATDSLWNSYVNPVAGLGTLFTAVAVWWGEVNQDWRDNLPKRLTVEYWYQGRLFMRCENARLFSESDIRALSQQIGGQMAAEHLTGRPEQLVFKAAAVQSSVGEVQTGDDDEDYLPYSATFELIALPPKLHKMEQEQGTYLEWISPFDKVDKVKAESKCQDSQ